MSKRNNTLIGIIVPAVIGLVFFLSGVGMLISTVRFMEDAVPAEGEVIHVAWVSGESTTYRPTMRYVVDEVTYERKSLISSSGYNFAPGQILPILYSRSDPGKMRLNFFMEIWGFGAIFAGIGALLLIGSLIGGGVAWRRSLVGRTRAKRQDGKPSRTPTHNDDKDRGDKFVPTVRRR